MTTLHIFGDSFFEEWPWDQRYDPPNTWQRQLGKRLNAEIKYYGLAGSAVDYTIKQFHTYRETILPNDYVIIGITNHNRLYSSLMPKDGCAAALLESPEVARENYGPHWRNAIEIGIKWFMDQDINRFHILDFLLAVDYYSNKGNFNPLVVSCFNHFIINPEITKHQYTNLTIAKGELYMPCSKEFMTLADKLHHERIPGDSRTNHFSWPNHDVLANKYYDYFVNKIPMDLTHGFVEKIVSLT